MPTIIDNIYQQFKDYFGEDKVDLKHYSSDIKLSHTWSYTPSVSDYVILVHWPVVTVTNEYDAHIDIWDLYSLTLITHDGKLCLPPQFIRTTYDRLQWNGDYMHSHISSIGKADLTRFHSSCLGSGPINKTIEKLKGNVARIPNAYEDMDIWSLYCWELDKYVAVESIQGVPYKKMQHLGEYTQEGIHYSAICLQPFTSYSEDYLILLRRFVRHLIKSKVLKFAYFNGKYTLALNYVNTVLTLSNLFIDYYNSNKDIRDIYPKTDLFDKKFISQMYIKGGVVYPKDSSSVPIDAVIGTTMLTFKRKKIELQLRDFHQKYDSSEVCLLNPILIDYIISLLLKYVNLKYGKTSNSTNKKCRVI